MPKTATTPKTKKSVRKGTKPPAVDSIAKLVTETIEIYEEILPHLPKFKRLDKNKKAISKAAAQRKVGSEPVEMRGTKGKSIVVTFSDRAGIDKEKLNPTQIAQVIRAFGDLLPLFMGVSPTANAGQVAALHGYEPTSEPKQTAKDAVQAATIFSPVGTCNFPD